MQEYTCTLRRCRKAQAHSDTQGRARSSLIWHFSLHHPIQNERRMNPRDGHNWWSHCHLPAGLAGQVPAGDTIRGGGPPGAEAPQIPPREEEPESTTAETQPVEEQGCTSEEAADQQPDAPGQSQDLPVDPAKAHTPLISHVDQSRVHSLTHCPSLTHQTPP